VKKAKELMGDNEVAQCTYYENLRKRERKHNQIRDLI
jgi:hypothetical protein